MEHETDVHAVSYLVGDEPEFPRLNKPVLPELQGKGLEVRTHWFGIDLDTPGHVELTEESYETFQENLAAKLPQSLQGFTAYYTTRAGARLIYVLDESISVELSEPYHRALTKQFTAAGIIADLRCSDWTHLFRMPFVMRDGVLQGQRSFDEIIINRNARLSLSDLRPIEGKIYDTKPAAPALEIPMPSDSVYEKVCEKINHNGATTDSDFLKGARRRLKGRLCFPCLFDGELLAEPSERDSKIHSYVGQACSLLSDASPEAIFALFLPAIQKLEPDAQTPDWRVPLWRAVCRYWPREIHPEPAKPPAAIEDILEARKAWDPSNVDTEFLRRNGIIAIQGKYYIMQPNGLYCTTPTERYHLIAKIRNLGMDTLFDTYTMSKANGISDKSIQGILNQYTVDGYEIDGVVDDRDGQVHGDRLIKTLFTRKTDIAPKFDPRVDLWLRQFAGSQYPNLIKWIGLALAWDEGPICALSIKSSPGSGKKMLIQGLVECVSTEKYSDAKEFTRFSSGIAESPFLVLNEGFPDVRSMPMSPADTFRAFVSGDPIRVEEKYKAPITVHNPLRIIFTTNNDDVLRALAGGRDLTPYDRDAISQRIFHLDVPDECQKWLLDLGGTEHTKGWIRRDQGTPGDYVIARHFMFLYENRPKQHGKRFLMEGTNNLRIVKALTLRSGGSPLIFEVITRLIEVAGKQRVSAVIENDKIYVTENMLEEYQKENDVHRRLPGTQVIRNVLAALRATGTEPEQATRGTGPGRRLAVWHQLNARLIMDEAIERGLPCARLQKLLGYIPENFPDYMPHEIR